MKIIDENGAAIENPDLTLGYLVDDTEPVEHPAVEGVEEVSHYETVTEYPGGGRDVRKVIDVPGVPAQAAWTEQVPIQKYIRYTAEELAAIDSICLSILRSSTKNLPRRFIAGGDFAFVLLFQVKPDDDQPVPQVGHHVPDHPELHQDIMGQVAPAERALAQLPGLEQVKCLPHPLVPSLAKPLLVELVALEQVAQCQRQEV